MNWISQSVYWTGWWSTVELAIISTGYNGIWPDQQYLTGWFSTQTGQFSSFQLAYHLILVQWLVLNRLAGSANQCLVMPHWTISNYSRQYCTILDNTGAEPYEIMNMSNYMNMSPSLTHAGANSLTWPLAEVITPASDRPNNLHLSCQWWMKDKFGLGTDPTTLG